MNYSVKCYKISDGIQRRSTVELFKRLDGKKGMWAWALGETARQTAAGKVLQQDACLECGADMINTLKHYF